MPAVALRVVVAERAAAVADDANEGNGEDVGEFGRCRRGSSCD